MTNEEIEKQARQEAKNYKTVYSEDFRFDEVMKDPLRFEHYSCLV